MKRRTAGAISRTRAIWIASLLTVAASATAQASLINYVIHNNGGLYDLQAPAPLTVTGGFSFDTATTTLSNFNVTFRGDSAVAGTYTDMSNPFLYDDDVQPVISFEGPAADGRLVRLRLKLSGLGDFGPYKILEGARFLFADPDRESRLLIPNDGKNLPTIAGILGEPVAATPEPSTWAMVLGAFAVAAAWMRRTGERCTCATDLRAAQQRERK